ncbi:tripartite tricarboxylate transporter substrate-binding protein [Haloplanus halophilus]|uniref:tripartite tricarboxylate transporter substrate-binding protein n=1 Tax=Haloplanus halophilus TaxID=2949993 RepID=UPI002041DFC0|nr:tripartite tricarboxylate transporter substrate-binding protein [Haloplanus sp. GDY1]
MRRSELSDASRRTFLKSAGAAGIVGLAGCMGGGNGGNGGDGDGGGGEDTASGGGSTAGESGGGSGGDGWTPDRNLTVIVPWGAGGGTDTMTRGIMQPAEEILQERGVDISIQVENITGANGLNGARRVLNRPADGYTLFASTQAISPNIALDNADFTLEEWAGVCRVQHDTSWIYSSGRDGVGHESLDSLLEKANGEGIQLGAVGGVTGAAFLIQFAEAAGILEGTQIVPYQDAGRMRTDIISGEIDGGFGEIQEMQSAYEAGDVTLLLVGTEDPVDDFPDVVAAGERDWSATYGVSRGFNAKAGTPTEALEYWEQLIEEAMESDSYQQLEQETLVYLREGYLPRTEFMDVLEQNVQLFNEMEETYEQVRS